LGYPGADQHPADEPAWVTVATTRPETYLADTAVAINPHDPRAISLRGLSVKLPLVGRVIPIVEDSYVVLPEAMARNEEEKNDPKAKFATGFLKVTPGHDKNDWELGQRHKLPVINMMSPDGNVSDKHGWTDVGSAHLFVGLSMMDARKKVVAEFKSHGLLESVKPYRQSVTYSDRSKAQVEPYLSDQWYVRVTDPRMAASANAALVADQRTDQSPTRKQGSAHVEAGAPSTSEANGEEDAKGGRTPSLASASGSDGDGSMRFHPDRYAKTFEQWHDNIRDWCISRQLWWGHRIPVWSCELEFEEGGYCADEHACGLASALTRAPNDRLNDSVNKLACVFSTPIDRWQPLLWSPGMETMPEDGKHIVYICLLTDDPSDWCDEIGCPYDVREDLAKNNFVQDPDVLDTWFSSALWPLSTMGWPAPTEETKGLLEAFNPSSTLCTAREIITLWVSRMTMFNRYFTASSGDTPSGLADSATSPACGGGGGVVPFRDVFIHAVIQDGEGQKMSKSLGNGVDPIDIIQTHGSDAMRFTLCTMSTHTQDVKLQVDLICPHTGEVFAPKMVTNKDGYRVPAVIQDSPKDKSKKMVTAYGVASGEVKASAEMPLARNTSSKFDMGRNFANKLWNASRFAVSILEKSKQAETPDTHAGWAAHTDSEDGPDEAAQASWKDVSVVDRWMVSRLATATKEMTRALDEFQFSAYAQTLYDVIWRDFCDWYLEAIKPTVASDARQRTVLWNAMGTLLRLAHPVMPFITEVIYERLKELRMGAGELPWIGLGAPMHQGKATKEGLLCHAGWPQVSSDAVSPEAEAAFARVQALVTAIREVRAQQNVQPKRKVTLNFPASIAAFVTLNQTLVGTLAGIDVFSQGDPKDEGVAFAFEGLQLRVTNLADAVDAGAERARLTKQVADLEKSAATFEGRLANPGYADRAPPAMVQQTRDQLAKVMKDLGAAREALAKLG
ncbi:MAG: class I tRNA ligase family protein, partial [Planctomycetota bacterium]